MIISAYCPFAVLAFFIISAQKAEGCKGKDKEETPEPPCPGETGAANGFFAIFVFSPVLAKIQEHTLHIKSIYFTIYQCRRRQIFMTLKLKTEILGSVLDRY